MELNFENIVIGTLFLGAVAWAVRGGLRSLRHSGGCTSCSSSGDCPLLKNPETLAELKHPGATSSPAPRSSEPTPCATNGDSTAEDYPA